MKLVIAASTLSLSLLLFSCEEARENSGQPLSEADFYKTIGEPIPFETGMEWIENYQKRNAQNGRVELLSSYIVPSAQIERVVGSVSDLTGVAFHYGIDDAGETHIVLVPIDETLSLWSAIPGRIFVDANSGEELSQTTAQAWAQRYVDANPEDVAFHFFGKNIFDDMKALPYFNDLDIEPAINTLELTPELLLIVWDETAGVSGRTSAENGMVYDASNACPPCAVQ